MGNGEAWTPRGVVSVAIYLPTKRLGTNHKGVSDE